MMKTSIASLKERLAGWTSWDIAEYHLGACLGFWPEFGAPPGEDQWNHVKGVIWSKNPLGDILEKFIRSLFLVGILECGEGADGTEYRWNPKYVGEADIITTL